MLKSTVIYIRKERFSMEENKNYGFNDESFEKEVTEWENTLKPIIGREMNEEEKEELRKNFE